jgi:hypothetical protein
MTKSNVLILIPLTIVAGLLLYCWTVILFTNIEATWRHYLALGLFGLLLYFQFHSWTKTVLFTGLYLLFGTCNLLSLTPSVQTNSFGLRMVSVEIWTPTFQLLSFGLLILYFFLNFDNLTNIYLDYKESKGRKL